jgi:hypothetical protein
MSHDLLYATQRTWRSVILGAALLALPACGGGGGSPTGPSTATVTGTYSLEEVDNDELPGVVHRGPYLDPQTGTFYNNYVLEITGGYMELREDETFYVALDISLTIDGQNGEGTFEMEGVWDLVKDELRLRIQAPFVATLPLEREGNQLHTDVDLMGLGEEVHLDFQLWKR